MWKSVSQCVVARCSVVLPLSRGWTSKARGGIPEPAPLSPLDVAVPLFSPYRYVTLLFYVRSGDHLRWRVFDLLNRKCHSCNVMCVFIQAAQERLEKSSKILSRSFPSYSDKSDSSLLRNSFRGSPSVSCGKEICYGWCGEAAWFVFSYENIPDVWKTRPRLFLKSNHTSCSPQSDARMMSDLSTRDRVIGRWLSRHKDARKFAIWNYVEIREKLFYACKLFANSGILDFRRISVIYCNFYIKMRATYRRFRFARLS